jgi:hypothetical protein
VSGRLFRPGVIAGSTLLPVLKKQGKMFLFINVYPCLSFAVSSIQDVFPSHIGHDTKDPSAGLLFLFEAVLLSWGRLALAALYTIIRLLRGSMRQIWSGANWADPGSCANRRSRSENVISAMFLLCTSLNSCSSDNSFFIEPL